MTSVEAFARKTPAVARDLGGLAEVIQESGGGLLYSSDEQLLDALDRIASSPSLRSELAEKGYQGFVRRWCTEAHLARYFEIIEGVDRTRHT
jgi:glycosyltransferase involved in cell wall biosynthesis